ncbi:MAG: alpha/beta fold hydrolase [Acidobacteria bacterium]|nr:alpha/beta fold hydrolase [Acidobacteriota bacterium]
MPQKTQKVFTANLQMSFRKPEAFRAEPKGTVFLLHGFGQQKEHMLHWALALAQQGYRCVLVDLRGHGGSSGGWIGYGAFEVGDLRSLLDVLAARQLIAGRIGVLGVSLGASVALQWAGADDRLATVVALEAFADPRRAMSTMVHNFPPFRRKLWWASEATLEIALDEAPKYAGFRWADVDVPKSVQAIPGPILFIHGAEDAMVPSEHSQVLCAVSKPGSRLLIVPTQDHITLALCLQPIDATVFEWMDQHLAVKP